MSYQIKSRPPIERMTKAYAMIRRGDFPNARALAKQFEVSEKSIRRDLAFLRDRLELPLVYDDEKHGWKLDKDMPLPWWI